MVHAANPAGTAPAGTLFERRVVGRIQDFERPPHRKQEVLLPTINSLLRGATYSRCASTTAPAAGAAHMTGS